MVVYAVAADASIIRIFLAGFLPGFLLMALFMGYIAWWSIRNPDKVPAADPPSTFMEKLRKSGNLIPVRLADRLHRLGAGQRLRHRHRMRGLRRGRFAGDRGLGPVPHLGATSGTA